MPGRRIVMGLAVVILVVTTGLRLVSAGPHVVAHCCCGTHDLVDDCGCPDCPSGHASDARKHDAPEHTTLKRCRVEGSPAEEPVLPVFTEAPVAQLFDPPAMPRQVFVLPVRVPAPDREPLLEPPR